MAVIIVIGIILVLVILNISEGTRIREFTMAYDTVSKKHMLTARTDNGSKLFKIYGTEKDIQKEVDKWNQNLLHGNKKLTTDNFFEIYLAEHSKEEFGVDG